MLLFITVVGLHMLELLIFFKVNRKETEKKISRGILKTLTNIFGGVFAKILNRFYPSNIFVKKLQHICFTGPKIRVSSVKLFCFL